jgi:hypothetical protein
MASPLTRKAWWTAETGRRPRAVDQEEVESERSVWERGGLPWVLRCVSATVLSVFEHVLQRAFTAQMLEHQVPQDDQGGEAPIIETVALEPESQQGTGQERSEALEQHGQGESGAQGERGQGRIGGGGEGTFFRRANRPGGGLWGCHVCMY